MSSSPSGPSRFVRLLVPLVLIVVWFAAAGVGGPYFGRVEEVSSNDQTTFLPASADATRVAGRLKDFLGDRTIPAIAVFTADRELSGEELETLEAAVEALDGKEAVQGVSPLIGSEDGRAAQAFMPINADADIAEVVAEVRRDLKASAPAGVTAYLTGPAGFTGDLTAAFGGIDGLLLLVALGAVLVILLAVYRSVLLPVVVLLTSLFALCVALLVNWWLAKWGVFTLTGQTQGILFILVIGAATDYSLLYTARYAEELRRHADKYGATVAALRGSLEPVLASGGTVIAGLLCLLLSDLGSNQSLGPVAAVGIVFSMLAALTLLPALLFVLGRAAYWPQRPVYDPHRTDEVQSAAGVYARIGRWIARAPRLAWIGAAALLALGAAFVPTLRAGGVPQSELVLGVSDARDGQRALAQHFPGGSGSPAYVLTAQGNLDAVGATLLRAPGVAAVSVLSEEWPSGSAPVTEDGVQGFGPPGAPPATPTVRGGDVLLQATLKAPADSAEAAATVRGLREQLGATARIGGSTAVAIDTTDTSIRDRTLIIPLILAVIFVILVLLLRSLLMPALLMATTVLSFGTALGVSALVFNGLLDLPGADPSVPLYGFVFLVALGIDYNIFLMTRVREEALRLGTRPGILRGLAVTGGVITSAGMVLAATFAALAVIPILFLLQLAFIVAFGVLLDTFLVRTVLVPALAYDLGPRAWWPARLPADRAP